MYGTLHTDGPGITDSGAVLEAIKVSTPSGDLTGCRACGKSGKQPTVYGIVRSSGGDADEVDADADRGSYPLPSALPTKRRAWSVRESATPPK